MVKFCQNYGAKPTSFTPSCRPATYSSQLAPEQREVCVAFGRILAAIGDEINQLPKQTSGEVYVVATRTVETNLKFKVTK